MRDLHRNMQPVLCRTLRGGDAMQEAPTWWYTGEYRPSHGVVFGYYDEAGYSRANLAPAGGTERTALFGSYADYTHTLSTTQNFGMGEGDLVEIYSRAHSAYTRVFRVMRVAESLNGTVYALKSWSHNDGT